MRHKIFFFLYKILGLGLCLSFWDTSYFWWIMLAFLLIYLLVISLGSYFIKFNWFIKSINENTEKGITFTFDDGPHPENTRLILDILKKHQVKATFFVIGKQAKKHPGVVKQIFEEGHIVGNHSYSHSNYIPFFRARKLIKDYKKSAETIKKITGKSPNYIRPPFGATSPKYTKLLRKTNYVSVGWSFRSFDTTAITRENLVSNTLNATIKNKNAILLFHDTKKITAESLDEILQKLSQNGTKIVNVEALTKQLPYE